MIIRLVDFYVGIKEMKDHKSFRWVLGNFEEEIHKYVKILRTFLLEFYRDVIFSRGIVIFFLRVKFCN